MEFNLDHLLIYIVYVSGFGGGDTDILELYVVFQVGGMSWYLSR
jgi:hypothetical protein